MKKCEWLIWVISLLWAGQVFAADTAHAPRQPGQNIVFHYGVVPAEVVLAHSSEHAERKVHGGAVSKGSNHLVVALFDAAKGERIADAEVTATVTLLGGASVTKRLEPMAIADQPSFGRFFSMGVPGIYRRRFEARRPGTAEVAAAEFEYRVSPEGRR